MHGVCNVILLAIVASFCGWSGYLSRTGERNAGPWLPVYIESFPIVISAPAAMLQRRLRSPLIWQCLRAWGGRDPGAVSPPHVVMLPGVPGNLVRQMGKPV